MRPGSSTFSPTVVSGSGSSTLTVTTSASTPPGDYPLTITGTSGSLTHTVTATLVVPAPPDFTLTVTPSAQAVSVGAAAGFTVTVASLNGFAGPVTLSVGGATGGSVASWSGNPVTAPGVATLRIRTTTSTPRGTFTLKLTGKSGALSHQASTTLVLR